MGMNLFAKLQSKIELYRLEQRYMRRKHRTTYHEDVQYVNGEYVYMSASPPTISKQSTGSYWRPSGWSRSHSDLRWR